MGRFTFIANRTDENRTYRVFGHGNIWVNGLDLVYRLFWNRQQIQETSTSVGWNGMDEFTIVWVFLGDGFTLMP